MQAGLDKLDPELDVLQSIYAHSDHVRQRDLARIAGLSLGMTNAVVKRLVQKGWLTIRKVNNRNIRYAVSPAGIDQIARRSYRYLRRTIRNIVIYRKAIENFVRAVKAQGYGGIVLTGASDLDFIAEQACLAEGIGFLVSDAAWEAARATGGGGGAERSLFVLYSESYIPDEEAEAAHFENVAFLQDVVNGKAPTARSRMGR